MRRWHQSIYWATKNLSLSKIKLSLSFLSSVVVIRKMFSFRIAKGKKSITYVEFVCFSAKIITIVLKSLKKISFIHFFPFFWYLFVLGRRIWNANNVYRILPNCSTTLPYLMEKLFARLQIICWTNLTAFCIIRENSKFIFCFLNNFCLF